MYQDVLGCVRVYLIQGCGIQEFVNPYWSTYILLSISILVDCARLWKSVYQLWCDGVNILEDQDSQMSWQSWRPVFTWPWQPYCQCLPPSLPLCWPVSHDVWKHLQDQSQFITPRGQLHYLYTVAICSWPCNIMSCTSWWMSHDQGCFSFNQKYYKVYNGRLR